MEASDDGDAATELGGGSIVVHKGEEKDQGKKDKQAKKEGVQPGTFVLEDNYPNPFNLSTQIGYQLPEAGEIRLLIYDLMGQPICTLTQGYRDAGYYQVSWNGRDDFGQKVSSGVYLYRFVNKEWTQTKRMLLLK